MQKYIDTKIKIVLTLLLLSFFFSTPVLAQRQGDVVRVGSDQVIDHDYFATGGQVVIDGTINGDAYIFGGDVEVNGKINGDLLIAGGSVLVKGDIAQDIRAAGGNVTIEGRVGRNISAAAGSLKLRGMDPVAGNVWVAGGTISTSKTIQKDLNIAGGDVFVDSEVRGSLNSRVGTISVGNNLKVAGDLNYQADQRAPIPPEASVSGKVNYSEVPKREEEQRFIGSLTKSAFYFSLYTNFVLFLITLLLWKLMPHFSQRVIETISAKPGWSTLVGLLMWIILPVAVVLALISIVGIPVAILVVVGAVILYFVASGFVATWVGQKILSNFGYHDSTPSAVLTGLIVLFILNMIPFVNFLVFLAIALTGVGALLKTKFDFFTKLRKENVL
jgi:hypothetical protein